MKIPIPLAILSAVLVAILTLFLCVRNRGFTTPPSEKELEKVEADWRKNNAPETIGTHLLKDRKEAKQKAIALAKQKKQTQTKKTVKQLTPTKQPTPPIPTPPATDAIPLGDIQQSPNLYEYTQYKEKGAAAYIKLAQNLEKNNAPIHALLAWERVLDSSSPTEKEIRLASSNIAQLKTQLPPWNTDTHDNITIFLHASATVKNYLPLKKALKTTTQLISEASGYIVVVKPIIHKGKGTPPGLPRTPVAIWFSSSKSPSTQTPPLSFMANPNQEKKLETQLQTATYSLLCSFLSNSNQYSPLPNPPSETPPETLLKSYVTRLIWNEFTKKLK